MQRSVLLPQLISSVYVSKKTSDGTIYTAQRSMMAELFSVDEVINLLEEEMEEEIEEIDFEEPMCNGSDDDLGMIEETVEDK